MLRIHGALPSRTFRCLWMLEECGVAYEHVRPPMADLQRPDYRRLNPNARVPVLEDGELVLWESMAINLHLARAYGGPLWPAEPAEQSRTLQWTLWAVTEAEPHVHVALQNRVMLPAAERSEEAVRVAERRLQQPLRVLDEVLGERRFLVGDDFGAADLNVASILSTLLMAGVEVDVYPEVQSWLHACLRRPYPFQFFARHLG